jgi:hypothetical protein
MERSRTRFLRIAVTALSLTVCVLLIALWVRSYRGLDEIGGSINTIGVINVASQDGHVLFLRMKDVTHKVPWFLETGSKSFIMSATIAKQSWGLEQGTLIVPHWFLVLLSAALAACPWIPRRFSLRTLQIATTLVAVGLGIIVLLS